MRGAFRAIAFGFIFAQLTMASGPVGAQTTQMRAEQPAPRTVAAQAEQPSGVVLTWGDDQVGQLGDPGAHECLGLPCPGRTRQPQLPDPIVAVAAGDYHTLALAADHTVWTWGANGMGQLGVPTTPDCLGGTAACAQRPQHVPGLADVTAIAAGRGSSFALKNDGSVWAWGATHTARGQPCGPTALQNDRCFAAPTRLDGIDDVVALSAGRQHALALRGDGTVMAWGSNFAGQLGDGTTIDRDRPVVVQAPSTVRAIAAGEEFSLAVLDDGSVWAWGDNSHAQLGLGVRDATPHPQPRRIDALSDVRMLAGARHALALKQDGTLWAWGDSQSGQIGDGRSGQFDAPRARPAQVMALGSVVSISAGASDSLAITADGNLWGWGWNIAGQVTGSSGPDIPSPTLLRRLRVAAIAVSAGANHSVAVVQPSVFAPSPNSGAAPGATAGESSSPLRAWGRNGAGQLAAGDFVAHDTALVARSPEGLTQLAAGGWHALGLDAGGRVWAWGSNAFGQLGDGSTTDRAEPGQVLGIERNVVAIAAGSLHSLALDEDGVVWAWGANIDGQLGGDNLGPDMAHPLPRAVPDLGSPVQAIAAGGRTSLALAGDGTVWTWGANDAGQLGPVADQQPCWRAACVTHPVPVNGLVGGAVMSISAGEQHSLALMADGTVWSWGDNLGGRLGHPELSDNASSGPVQVRELGEVVAISAGGAHSLALKSDGTVWAWGAGRLGAEDVAPLGSGRVVQVSGLRSITAVSSGANHDLALDGGGTLWTWGDNSDGQLGDAPGARLNGQVSQPVAVRGITGGLRVAAGTAYSLVLLGGATPDPEFVGWAGDPVNTFTGHFVYNHLDLTLTSTAGALNFQRSYNGASARVGDLGPGWSHTYEARIISNTDGPPENLTYIDGAGFVGAVFHPSGRNEDGDTTYAAEPGVDVQLRHTAQGRFELTGSIGAQRMVFTQGGRLAEIEQSSTGKRVVVARAPDGTVSTVGDQATGQVVSFHYDRNKRLVEVDDWLDPPRVLRFGYDEDGRLAGATDRDGNATTYTYARGSARLTSIVDANGHAAATMAYDDDNRVISQTDARGQVIHFDYEVRLNAAQVTTMHYPSSGFEPLWSTLITDRYQGAKLIERVIQPSSGDDPLVEETTYDAQGKPSRRTHGGTTPYPPGTAAPDATEPGLPPGEATERAWAAVLPAPPGARADLVTRLVAVSRNPQLAVALRLLDQQSLAGPDQIPTFTRDDVGRLTDLTLTTAGGEPQTWHIDYSAEDRPRFIYGPGNAEQVGPVMELRWDAVGNLVAVVDVDGEVTELAYDERDSLSDIHLPSGTSAHYDYDDRGDLSRATMTSADGHLSATDYRHDGLHRLRQVIDYLDYPYSESADVITYAYDDQGNQLAFRSLQ